MRTLEGTYGCRRIQAFLERRGVRADGATIRSIMRELGLRAAQLWARLRATVPAATSMSALTSSGGTSPPSHQDVSGAGISPTSAHGPGSSVLYLATVLDCCTKKVVGYAMVAHMRTSLVRGH